MAALAPERHLADGDCGRPLVVAVTGGIASGKSALTARFEALGVPVADADIAARAVVEPGSEGLTQIVAAFGDDVLSDDGGLDRRRVRELVFADPHARKHLEGIVHPRVRAWLVAAVEAWCSDYGLLAIPLLAENAQHYRWVDRVLVVDVPESVQIERLMHRDDADRTLAESILAAQATRPQRLAIADEVHDATGPIEALADRVATLHQTYLEFAVAKRGGRLPLPRIRATAAPVS